MAISAEQIVNMFKEDAKARRRLTAILVLGPEVRLAITNELEALKSELKGEIARVEDRIMGR